MTHIGMGILLIFLGYLVKVKKMTWLIAGYNTSPAKKKQEYDIDALTDGMGKFLYLLGAISLVGSIGEIFHLLWLLKLIWALFVAVTLVFLIYANTGGRFKKD